MIGYYVGWRVKPVDADMMDTCPVCGSRRFERRLSAKGPRQTGDPRRVTGVRCETCAFEAAEDGDGLLVRNAGRRE